MVIGGKWGVAATHEGGKWDGELGGRIMRLETRGTKI